MDSITIVEDVLPWKIPQRPSETRNELVYRWSYLAAVASIARSPLVAPNMAISLPSEAPSKMGDPAELVDRSEVKTELRPSSISCQRNVDDGCKAPSATRGDLAVAPSFARFPYGLQQDVCPGHLSSDVFAATDQCIYPDAPALPHGASRHTSLRRITPMLRAQASIRTFHPPSMMGETSGTPRTTRLISGVGPFSNVGLPLCRPAAYLRTTMSEVTMFVTALQLRVRPDISGGFTGAYRLSGGNRCTVEWVFDKAIASRISDAALSALQRVRQPLVRICVPGCSR